MVFKTTSTNLGRPALPKTTSVNLGRAALPRRLSHGIGFGRLQSGFTIVEFLVGLVISVILLSQICALWFYSSRSFVAQMNYVDLDRTSQYALDSMSRDIRQVKKLTAFTTNQLVFTDYDDKELRFQFSGTTLTRMKLGIKKVLLNDCTSGTFAIYQRNPVAGVYDQYPTADPATCKLVELRWTCAKKIFPSAPTSTESMQSAKIVIRSNN